MGLYNPTFGVYDKDTKYVAGYAITNAKKEEKKDADPKVQ